MKNWLKWPLPQYRVKGMLTEDENGEMLKGFRVEVKRSLFGKWKPVPTHLGSSQYNLFYHKEGALDVAIHLDTRVKVGSMNDAELIALWIRTFRS